MIALRSCLRKLVPIDRRAIAVEKKRLPAHSPSNRQPRHRASSLMVSLNDACQHVGELDAKFCRCLGLSLICLLPFFPILILSLCACTKA